MISRLTATAALFAILGAATLTFAAQAQAQHQTTGRNVASGAATPVIQLPRVEVIGHRIR